MLRIKHKIERAKKDKEEPTKILFVTINGHKIQIKNWRFSEIKVIMGNKTYHLINPTVNNKYTIHQVLNGLRNNKCINPCNACGEYCEHCRCLKPCGLCDIRTAWKKGLEITDKHRWWFIPYDEDYQALKKKINEVQTS